MRSELRPYFALILITVILDQLTKYIIQRTFSLGESRQVFGDFIRFTFVHNAGGAFGIALGGYWLYTVLSAAAVLVVIIYFWKASDYPWLPKAFLALIVGGAVGNVIDRIFHGQVVDFIDVDFFDIVILPFRLMSIQFDGFELFRWYTFNMADAAITVGLLGLIILIASRRKASPRQVEQANEGPGS